MTEAANNPKSLPSSSSASSETASQESPCAILTTLADLCGSENSSTKRNVAKLQIQMRSMGGIPALCKLIKTLQDVAACFEPETD